MNTLQHEKRLVRIATLCSKCTTAEEVLLELEHFLPYLLQFGGIKDVIKYASAFKTLDFRKVSKETREAARKKIEIDDAWHTVNAENAAPFEYLVDLQEEDAITRTLEEYDQLDAAYKEKEESDKRLERIKEIAIQAVLEGVDPNIIASFKEEYLQPQEYPEFDNVYYQTIVAAEGRNGRFDPRTDYESYHRYKVNMQDELNAWAEDNMTIIPYSETNVNPQNWRNFFETK